MSSIKYFPSVKYGKAVALNTSLREIAILQAPNMQEMDDILRAHEAAIFDHLWAVKLAAVSEKHNCLEAFVGNPSGALKYFVHTAVNVHLKTQKVRGFGHDVRALSLPEQRVLLDKLRPTDREDFKRIASTNGLNDLLGQDLRRQLRETGDVTKFIHYLFQRASGRRESTLVRSGGAEQSTEVLIMMRERGHILLPLLFKKWSSSAKWRAALNPQFSGELALFMGEIGALLAKPTSDLLVPFGQVCILMSSLDSIDDLSGQLIDAMHALLLEVTERPAHARNVARAFHIIWNNCYPDSELTDNQRGRRSKPQNLLRTSGHFGWLASRNSTMSRWQVPLSSFVAQREAASKQPVIADLNYFCDFLLTLPHPPQAPEFVERTKHIRDVMLKNQQTFMRTLGQSKLNSRRRTRILGYVREFFDWYQDWLSAGGRKDEARALRNPISTQDNFQPDSKIGHTHRTALPSWLLRELNGTLTADDFAFAKAKTKHDWNNLFDRETSQISHVWWPGTAIILSLLLDLPIRGHQGRWLDSGEFDEIVYDITGGCDIPNRNSRAIPGRREACIRLLKDTLRQESWVGGFINTNKTALYKSDRRGYEIPYMPPESIDRLDRMSKWNRRYLPPLKELVTYKEEGRGRVLFGAVDDKKLPKIAPLFRDPRSSGQNRPPSSDKIAALWLRVLRETELRIKRERGVDIKLTEINAAGQRVWRYDVHTLRVSGISAMIENGVPLEIVSQFVAGHATLVMTLWYHRHSLGRLREVIEKAHLQAIAEGDFVGTEHFEKHIEKFSPFLLSKNALRRLENEDVAYNALKQHTGLWTVSSDGICPGTSCATGGELDDQTNTYGPVPGGRRCGLCRYWMTGPAFLLGQMAEANNLIYSIRKKGLELKAARDELIDYEDSGRRGQARQTRSRIELLERELEIDLLEWQARHSYAMSSSALLEEYIATRDDVLNAESLPVALLTSNSEEQLKLTLQEADEFVLLDHVTQMANILPGYKNREASMEKQAILTKLLVDNGLPPFLLSLDRSQAEVAGNLMSSMLLEFVEAQDRARLFANEIKLGDLPAAEERLKKITAEFAPVLPDRRLEPIPIPIRLERK